MKLARRFRAPHESDGNVTVTFDRVKRGFGVECRCFTHGIGLRREPVSLLPTPGFARTIGSCLSVSMTCVSRPAVMRLEDPAALCTRA